MLDNQSQPLAPTPATGHGGVAWIVWALLLAGFIGFTFYDGIVEVVRHWTDFEEYSHGFLIPLVSLYLAWQRKDELRALPVVGSLWGVAIVLAGIALMFVGELSTLYILVISALIVTLTGIVVTIWGWPGFRLLWVPLVYLVFMIPIPPFLQNKLSGVLQLLSSEIGVMVIRLFGISVFLEGNVIDLGSYQLQVVEACNGLRYLYPLASFGFLLAYMFQAPLWQRAVIFLSTIPITVLMNSFRIGVIGVLVEYFGIEQAEGFLHDFEGWVVFMVCVAILLAEMWLLARLTGDRRPWREVFKLDIPRVDPRQQARGMPRLPAASVGVCVLLGLAAVGVYSLGQRQEVVPTRQDLTMFPTRLDDWRGRPQGMEQRYLDALKLSDYLLADYQNGSRGLVNLYVAWYDSQRKGHSIHSPRSCIPGGGWEISSVKSVEIPSSKVYGQPLHVNRVEIQKGPNRQLVYYWFQQRGRVINSEYMVKGYLLWDALTRQRTDGALVRLTTPVQPGESWSQADERLIDFAKSLSGELEPYIPS
ncbi:MAG: VPLPA-CTERM-specific exosortase XrtD [Gammaproteobacteria bacterium]|nr:VPLPA-CTERM-specific exosortase XrtD [Gammaproteobacteria bacterium]